MESNLQQNDIYFHIKMQGHDYIKQHNERFVFRGGN